jgi:hypothetical protein
MMAKIQNFSELSQSFSFTEYDFFDFYRRSFERSELGRIKKLLPLREMAENFGLVNKRRAPKRGRKPYFTPEGKVALMFLKMYTQTSSPKLMEQLNGNVHYQIFCGIRINPENPLTNYKLIDNIACELAGKMKIQQLQNLLAKAWKPHMKDLDTMYTDATCYESEMRYPTDQKLLWECCEKAYKTMCETSSRLGIRRPRTKYLDVEKANLGYAKQRKHSKSQTRRLTRRLLHLLGKMLKEIRKMEREHADAGVLTDKERRTMDIVTKVYRQQSNHFESGNPRESIPDRIVSVSKPYVRPIIRGKDVKKIGGDTGYARTANRDFCKENGIQTSFVKRGRPSQTAKEKDFVRQELAKVRATTMEGSFGTQKEHYSMRRIKARKKETEILYIFFGIHTANAVRLAERLLEGQQAEAA